MSDLLDPPATVWTDEGGADDAAEGPPHPDDDAGRSRWQAWADTLRRPESIITLLVVAACTIFVFIQLQPSQLFKNTTPAGGDMGAHVWLPAYIKRQLLPHFQIFGWTMDWYAGFPALSYYFPLPMVAIAVISYVIPYNISFKLVSVAGLVALPVVCFALGRLARMRFPGPACLAVAAVPYLFNRDFTIYGGNIASTMAGEFCFSISLAFAVLFLGFVARGMSTGRNRALAAVVLALCGLSHILPLFFAIGGAGVLFVMSLDFRRLRWSIPVLGTGGLLIAFWALPFEYRLPYATNMGYAKITTYLTTLFPHDVRWLFYLAGLGALLAIVRRNRIGVFLLLMTLLCAFVFRFAPNARLWNARVLPFWFLCLYLLVGVAFAEFGTILVAVVRGRRRTRGWAMVPIPLATLLVGLIWTGFPLRILPLGHVSTATGKYDWLGITSSDNSFIPGWVKWNFSGYQSPDKSGRTTYFALINEMKKLARTPGDGCGRSMYEYEAAINDMGTSDALMLLPYWTSGCISTMEGLYYESAATTPYHFLNAAELSAGPSNPMVGLDYPAGPDVAEGIDHLQMFGIKYYLAVTPSVQRQAARDKSLRYLASVGPYQTDVTNASNQNVVEPQTWKIYKVLNSPLVAPLANQPVVMKNVAGTKWLGQLTSADGVATPQNSPSESWYLTPSRWDVYEAASGPASWARVAATDTHPPKHPEPHVTVSHIVEGEESISFDVDRTGVPILVKTSYFPNWKVSGAKAIYRVTPNLMVVVPTSDHVSFTYGYTPVDWTGLGLSVIGLGLVVVLWRRPIPKFRTRRVGSHAVATGPYGDDPRLPYGAGQPGADDDSPSWLHRRRSPPSAGTDEAGPGWDDTTYGFYGVDPDSHAEYGYEPYEGVTPSGDDDGAGDDGDADVDSPDP
jgi:hypothetical protein